MSADSIHQRMLTNTDDKYDKSAGSWTYDVESAVAKELAEAQKETHNIIDKTDVEKLTGDDLTRFVYQRTAIERNLATKATDNVILTVTAATSVTTSDLVAAEDIFYSFVEPHTFTAPGEYTVQVECVQAGIIGNVPAGSINSFPVTLNNISGVRNESAFANGYEEETDKSLRTRYYNRLQRPGKSGNKDHYREWAQEVAGVGRVKVFARWAGPLTVKVAILDMFNELAPQLLINRVFRHIEVEKPFGADVKVVTATQKMIDVSASFVMKDDYTWEEVLPKLQTQLREYFRNLRFDETTLYMSHAQIGREILSVEGIQDYSDLLLNGSADNVDIDAEEIPVLGSVTTT